VAVASAAGLVQSAGADAPEATAKIFLASEDSAPDAPAALITAGASSRQDLYGDYPFVKLRIVPAPNVAPQVEWHVSNENFAVTDHPNDHTARGPVDGTSAKTNGYPSSVGTYVHADKQQIVTTLSARIGSPYNVELSVPVYSAPRLNLLCYVPYRSGIALASPNSYPGAQDTDIFLSRKPFEPGVRTADCTGADEASLFIVFPGGGVVLDEAFQKVRPSEWSPSRRDYKFSELSGKTILFKSLSGLIVKATYGGPIIFSLDDNAHFPDESVPLPHDLVSVTGQT
jgi:hypothetical protein